MYSRQQLSKLPIKKNTHPRKTELYANRQIVRIVPGLTAQTAVTTEEKKNKVQKGGESKAVGNIGRVKQKGNGEDLLLWKDKFIPHPLPYFTAVAGGGVQLTLPPSQT